MSIYLDNAATTATSKEVLNEMLPYFCDVYGNPSSMHSYGRKAISVVDDSRELIAKSLNCSPNEVYFTSGGTESDNWAIKGLLSYPCGDRNKIVIGATEHPAILNTAKYAESIGYRVEVLPVKGSGEVDIDYLSIIDDKTLLCSVMYVNNETGVINPIELINNRCKEVGSYFHTDAVQAMPCIKIDLKELSVDMLSISSHKIHGPKGIGLLYVNKRVKLNPLIDGGAQERGKRGGTTNTPLIVGFAKAIEILDRERDINNSKTLSLKTYFEEKLSDIAIVNGTNRVSSISNLSFIGKNNNSLLTYLDLNGVAVSAGSACTAGSLEPSKTLLAMGLPDERVKSALRFSFGADNTIEEIDYVISLLKGNN